MVIDPTVLVGLAGVVPGYVALWRRAAPARPVGPAAAWRLGAGLVALAVAVSTPFELAAAGSLAAHMVQHQLLVLVAAPLLASCGVLRLARAATVGRLWLRPPGAQGRAIVAVAAATIHLGVLLAWHVPAAYDAALASDPLHHLEHLSLLATAVVAWAAILAAAMDDRAVFGAVLGLALLAIGGAVLGVVLLTSPVPLYTTYGAVAGLDEQRVAGALMKVGALVVYAGAAVVAIARWFRRLDVPDAAPVAAPNP